MVYFFCSLFTLVYYLLVKTANMGTLFNGSTILLVKTAYKGLIYGRLRTWVYHFVCKDTLHGSILW